MNKKDVEARISGLLEKMTLEEKIGQLVQSGPSLVGGFTVPVEELFAMAADGRISPEEFQKQMEGAKEDIPEDEIRKGSVGSFLGVTGAKISPGHRRSLWRNPVLGSRCWRALMWFMDLRRYSLFPWRKAAALMKPCLRKRPTLLPMKPAPRGSTGYLRL